MLFINEKKKLFCLQHCVSVAGGGGAGGGGGGASGRLSLHLRPCGGSGGGVVGGDSTVSDYPPSAAAVRNREAAAAALHAARTLLGAGVANPCSPTPEPPFWKMPHKGLYKSKIYPFFLTANRFYRLRNRQS